jgi:hypothetical protein
VIYALTPQYQGYFNGAEAGTMGMSEDDFHEVNEPDCVCTEHAVRLAKVARKFQEKVGSSETKENVEVRVCDVFTHRSFTEAFHHQPPRVRNRATLEAEAEAVKAKGKEQAGVGEVRTIKYGVLILGTGNDALKSGNTAEAIRMYSEAITLMPDGPNTHL